MKNVINRGIGFSPGSAKYIPTLGFTMGAAPSPTAYPAWVWPVWADGVLVLLASLALNHFRRIS